MDKKCEIASRNVKHGKASSWDGVPDYIFTSGGRCCGRSVCGKCLRKKKVWQEVMSKDYWKLDESKKHF